MNDSTYSIGIRFFAAIAKSQRLQSADTITRVWMRYRKILTHLRTFQFDGVVDGGANVGEFAMLVRSALPQADLVCVEPNRECVAALNASGFRVVSGALWSQAGRLKLFQPTEASTSCSVVEQEGAELGEVDAIRLDQLAISGNRLLVKLDLQGAELSALEGMTNLWPRCIAVMAEVSIGPAGNYEAVRDVLTKQGFLEYSTCNELEVNGRTVEADKLWVRREALESAPLS